MDGDEAGSSLAGDILAADGMTGRLGRDHEHIHVCGRNDLLEMNVEAVRKSERFPLREVGKDALLIDLCLFLVGREDHDDVRSLCRFGSSHHFQTRLFRFCPGLAALIQTDDDFYAALFQVQRMRMALAAVTDNGNGLVFEKIQVRVLFIEGFHVLSLTGNSKHSENTAQRGPSQNHLRACA